MACESLTYEMVSAPEERRKGIVVLCGFNKASQMVTNMISSPLVGSPVPWIAFEFDPTRVRLARTAGLPVFFGDGSRREVLQSAGVEDPRAFVLTQVRPTAVCTGAHSCMLYWMHFSTSWVDTALIIDVTVTHRHTVIFMTFLTHIRCTTVH